MFRIIKNYRFAFVFSFSFFFCHLAFSQRAETSLERNSEVKEINELYTKGKWEEGKSIAEANVKENPKDSDMRMMLGKYYVHKGQYDKARYELVKSLEYAPANVDAKQMLVTVETETKRFSSAICYINELLEVNPYWKGLWRQKIDLYRTMGNHVEADRLLKRILQIYPNDTLLTKDQSYLLEQRTVAFQKSGKIDEVIEISKKRIVEEPSNKNLYTPVIDNYIKAGDYASALVYTERALNTFPGNSDFVQKKIAILEHQLRYPEILSFIEGQMKSGAGNLANQYSYFLLEAARKSHSNNPATLYGKIFANNPSNREAFDYVFIDLIAKEQYEEALLALGQHKRRVGESKVLDMKELMVYRRMGSTARVTTLTRNYFLKYPEDSDLREAYVNITANEAKENLQDGRISAAIDNWNEVIQYADDEIISLAKQGLYNAYVSGKRYQEAIMVLDEMLLDKPGDIELLLKKSDLYNKDGRYEYAINLYEQVLATIPDQERDRLMSDYSDMVSARVKVLREDYHLVEARQLADRWLTIDQRNPDALLAMINISYELKDIESMLRYAQMATNFYQDNISFKIKLAEAMNHNPEQRSESWSLLYEQVKSNSFHDPLVNTFIYTSEEFAGQLLKDKDFKRALGVLDTALIYKDNVELKYMKGLAYEGLKNYDSAYVFQQFFTPSLMEIDDFKDHLNFLASKTYRNNIGISHLRARFGDDYTISSVSSAEYSYYKINGSSYTGRINYAGRDKGKGIQGQVEWFNVWSEKLSSRIDLALSNKYFANIAGNAAAYYEFKSTWEAELGLGFRKLFTEQNLFNANLGITKTIDDLRLNAKLSNILLDSEGELTYLYSVSGKAQYYLNNPKNYLLALGSVGNSPDIDLLDNQFYNSFNVFNAMVGAGVGRSLAKNVGANVIGTWYNFQTSQSLNQVAYKNFYNLHFQLNVSF